MTSPDLPSKLVCTGCGTEVPADEPFPFRCPGAGEDAASGSDVDHVLRRELDASFLPAGKVREIFLDPEPDPFLRYRRLFHGHIVGLSEGFTDSDYVKLVRRLDQAVARVDPRGEYGFRETPFEPEEDLARRLGLADEKQLRVKDETGNVSGSHKGRHLQGVMLWLEQRLQAPHRQNRVRTDDPPLAIASCGNAALAAAVVARAAGRRLEVFVPPDAHPRVLERLVEHGAQLVPCPRTGEVPGDPCFHRFREAVAAGAVPFTCQGSENGLVIEGGKTLVWEMVSRLLREAGTEPVRLDRLLVQVGGGALASACFLGLREAQALGLLERMPRLDAVQTGGASPLRRAWRRVVERLLGSTAGTDEECARRAAERPDEEIRAALRHAATHRSEYMWPWESEPRSLATGILDDETYDWLAVVEGMLTTGGRPLVVSEERLAEAHRLGREHTGIRADPTGTAGLAGLMELARAEEIGGGERVAVLFTGAER